MQAASICSPCTGPRRGVYQQRGIPVVEEPRPLVVEVPVISGVVDPRSAGEKINDWT
jgi:hypothetical protein